MSPPPRTPQRAGAVGGAVVILGLGSALGLGACGDLVAGDRASVTAQLCEQLGACYGLDRYGCDAMERTLREATVDQRDEFLSSYSEEACLDSCPGSLACLDNEPFCTRDGACTDEKDCCRWSLGLAACEPEGKTCCAPRGVACESSDDCCDADCESGYCGGTACVLVGQSCRRDDECCTRRCDGGVCGAKTCSALGDPCLADGDCCPPPTPGVIDIGAEPQAVCDPKGICVLAGTECLLDGAPCDPEGSGLRCCEDAGLFCSGGPGGGICGAPGCAGPGVDCAFDAQCCAGSICDYDLGAVCASPPVEGCGKAGAACSEDAGCCPGRTCTELGVCSEPGGPTCPIETPCHSPYLVGGPMQAGACAGTPDACCVDLVAQSDSFCSCIAWDLVCADKAALDCPAACP